MYYKKLFSLFVLTFLLFAGCLRKTDPPEEVLQPVTVGVSETLFGRFPSPSIALENFLPDQRLS